MPPSKGKVLLAMSGGVDSSVAAALLLDQGYEVIGCFMRLGSQGDSLDDDPHACDLSDPAPSPRPPVRLKIHHQGCCSISDAADARTVAAQLGIPFYVRNFRQHFARVISYFTTEYLAGRTPNPCIRCNDWLKFGSLHDTAVSLGADFVASGHYARVALVRGRHRLLRAIDHAKDQSYVLFGIPHHRLAHMLLPIGGLHKDHVRDIARRRGLPVFDKPDSQEICFVPDNDYAAFIDRRLAAPPHSPDPSSPRPLGPGPILDTAGRVIGTHPGHHHFTIGQRRGVGLGARLSTPHTSSHTHPAAPPLRSPGPAESHPVYVLDRDPSANSITVGPRDALRARSCIAHSLNWPDERDALEWRDCLAKVRSNSAPVRARVRRTDDDTLETIFDDDVFAIAPGQAVVCYDALEPDLVLAGGWIDSVTLHAPSAPPPHLPSDARI